MSQASLCPRCGNPLPQDAPAGLCPTCLIAQGRGGGAPGALQPTTPSPERFTPPEPAELAALFPQLEIVELLGTGGMGAVYKARQPGLDRLVALKILPPELGRDPAFGERFTREAQALARLNHPNIVTVYEFGQAPSPRPSPPGGEGGEHGKPGEGAASPLAPWGRGAGGKGEPSPAEPDAGDNLAAGNGPLYYLLMEYVDGTSLRELIRHGKLKPEEALAIVPQICEALQYAHDEGVVHRDIKPENLLVDKRGRVKIADFGLAKIAGRPPAGEAAAVGKQWTLTETGQVMGTQHYMAPEQLKGSHQVDHRADIYSLGVVFYEMLTGELPIGRFEPPSKKVRVDVRLDEVVLRALENEPARRYQKVSDVKTDVERVSRAEKPPQPTLPGVEPIPPDLEESILSHLPENITSAVKLYRAKTGAGLDEAFMAVKAIARRHGIEFAPIPLRRRFAMCALMAVMIGIYVTGYLLFRQYVHLSSIITGTLYYVLMTGITAFFAVSAWRYRRYRGTRRYQGMLLLTGLFCFAFFVAPLLDFLAEPEPVLNWLYRVSGAKPGEHDVFFVHTLFAAIILGTLAWLIRFWFKLRARSRSSDKESAESPRQGPPVVSAADRELVATARRQVRGPAIGLTVAGCIGPGLVIFGMVIWVIWSMGHYAFGDLEITILLFPVFSLSVWGLFVIVGANKMRRLESYGFAVAGAIMAIVPLVGPAWVLSLPMGIWALIVLTRPGVKDAFRKNATGTGGSSTAGPGEGAVGRRPGRPFIGRLVAMAIMASALVIIAAFSYFYRRPPSPLPSGATATVRKIPMTEAERGTPGLSVYRYELKLPPGHHAEFSTELWRHGKPEESRIHRAGGRAGNGRLELRLQQGETLSPEGKDKLRWDWRADNKGVKVETGEWIDDPFAGVQAQCFSQADQWQLTPGKEYTLLILLGWEQPTAVGVPAEYFDAPTALAEAIEKGEIPRADVELYLKVRLRRTRT